MKFTTEVHHNIICLSCLTEWICCVYYEETILNENELEIDITNFYECLFQLNTNSQIALIAKAAYLMHTDNLINSRECVNQAILLNAQSFYAWFLLNKVCCKLYCWDEAEEASRQAIRLLKPSLKEKLHYKIKLTLLEAMSRSSDMQKLIRTRRLCEEEVGTITASSNVRKFSID